uniref:Uncharacterized protein n=1 Tax=Arundo donax TaxID=35708 RepID=A0A0A9BRA9_ARUDO
MKIQVITIAASSSMKLFCTNKLETQSRIFRSWYSMSSSGHSFPKRAGVGLYSYFRSSFSWCILE